MKTATYKNIFNEDIEVGYDENAPCRVCGLPVVHASMGGTDLCPWCDCGRYRDGTEIDVRELMRTDLLKKKAEEVYEKLKKPKEEPLEVGLPYTPPNDKGVK